MSFGTVSVSGPAATATLTYSDPADLVAFVDPSGEQGNTEASYCNNGLDQGTFQALGVQVVAFNGAPTSFTYKLNKVVASYNAIGTVTFTFPDASRQSNPFGTDTGYNYGGATSAGRIAFSGNNAFDSISTFPTMTDDNLLHNYFDAKITTTGGNGVGAVGVCVSFRSDQKVYGGPLTATLSDGSTETLGLPDMGVTSIPGNWQRVFIGYQAPAGKTITRIELCRSPFPGGGYCVVDDLAFQMVPSAPLIGDLNSDGVVGTGDLQLLVGVWASGPGYSGTADINGDGRVNIGDLQLMVAHWGDHN